jgi:inner membrane protein
MIALNRMCHERPGDRRVLSVRDDWRTVVTSGGTIVWPILALAAVCGLDAVIAVRHWPIPALGLLDEAGHLLTAIVLLAASTSARIPRLTPWALLGAVAIDVDHIPLYTFAPRFVVSGRPPTHSLITVLALLIAALVFKVVRVPLLGIAMGICLHFVRDVATGPGLPLFWPFSRSTVMAPYGLYVAVVAVAAAIAIGRLARLHCRSRPNSPGNCPDPRK